MTPNSPTKDGMSERTRVLSNLRDILDTLEGSNRTDEQYNQGWNDAIESIRTNIRKEEWK